MSEPKILTVSADDFKGKPNGRRSTIVIQDDLVPWKKVRRSVRRRIFWLKVRDRFKTKARRQREHEKLLDAIYAAKDAFDAAEVKP